MSNADALVAIVLLAVFLGGIAAGVILIVSAASRREDSFYSLDGEPPDAVCRGVRRLTGTWVLGAGFRPAPQATPNRKATPIRDADDDKDPPARWQGARR
jgi:hypothetical protein